MRQGKMLYLSCHATLEHQEVKLFTEMGWDVFSFGSYLNPTSPHDPKRPPIQGRVDAALMNVAIQCSQENLLPELIEPFDLIYVMHRDDWILSNWEKFKGKTVVWRTIGQSIPDMEGRMALPRAMGMKIVRYSPEEKNMDNYVGGDAVIRFYADPEEFKGYTGEVEKVMTVAQSMKKREPFCGYGIFDEATRNNARVVFGPGNEEIPYSGGLLTYDELREAYKKHRAYFYTGTYPASYTLNFIEALMTGIPIVAIGRQLADLKLFSGMDCYEVDKIIENGKNGFISNSIEDLSEYVNFLLERPFEAREIGERGRKTAIELFGVETIKKQWKEFLESC